MHKVIPINTIKVQVNQKYRSNLNFRKGEIIYPKINKTTSMRPNTVILVSYFCCDSILLTVFLLKISAAYTILVAI